MRRTRLRQVSAKRARERVERLAVVELVRERDRTCRAALLVPEVACSGPYDVHEVVQRSLRPGVHLEPDLCILVCRRHHDWIDLNIARAHELGLLVHSWEAS